MRSCAGEEVLLKSRKWLRGLDNATLPRSKSRVQIPSPAPDILLPTGSFPSDGLFPAGTLTYGTGARYPSGKGEVCKTFMRRFDSDPRLQTFLPSSLTKTAFTVDLTLRRRAARMELARARRRTKTERRIPLSIPQDWLTPNRKLLRFRLNDTSLAEGTLWLIMGLG